MENIGGAMGPIYGTFFMRMGKAVMDKEIIEGNDILNMRADKSINVYRAYVDNYFISLEMAGVTLTLMRLDGQLKQLLDVPADAVHFKQF